MPRILAIPRHQAPALPLEACLPWRERADIEQDESLLQLIPYVVLHNAAGELCCYACSGGDTRLDGRWSCGVGGHAEEKDSVANLCQTLANTARREMIEELGIASDNPPASPCLTATKKHLYKSWHWRVLVF